MSTPPSPKLESHRALRSLPRPPVTGFTLTDLLVVIATLAVLAAMLLPAFAGTRHDNRLFQCLNNQRKLALAFIAYAADNNDAIVPFASAGGFWVAPSFGGMTPAQAQAAVLAALRTNNYLYPFAPDVRTYHCPEDGRIQKSSLNAGWAYDSYSKTQNVGGEDYNNWWGTGGSYVKASQIRNPALTFAFTEDADWRNRNAGTFVLTWNLTTGSFTWVDPPAIYHGQFSTFSFADGHAVIHKWQHAAILNAGIASAQGLPSANFPGPTSGTDYQFMHDHYRFPSWK